MSWLRKFVGGEKAKQVPMAPVVSAPPIPTPVVPPKGQQISFSMSFNLAPKVETVSNKDAAIREHKAGNLVRAAELYKVATQELPADVALKCNYGMLLLQMGRAEEGKQILNECLSQDPTHIPSRVNRARAFWDDGQHQEAIDDLQLCLRNAPDNWMVRVNLASMCMEQGRFAEGLSVCSVAGADPAAEAKLNHLRGLAYLGLNEYEKSCEALKAALTGRAVLDEESVKSVLSNLSAAYSSVGRRKLAEESLKQLMAMDDRYPMAAGQLMSCKLAACEWDEAEPLLAVVNEEVKQGHVGINPFAYLNASDDAELHLENAKLFGAKQFPEKGHAVCKVERYGHEKLRVGYLSADFHNHATAYLIAGLIETHDRSSFEVYGFSYGPNERDDMRQRLESAFDHFVDVRNMDDLDVAKLIASHEIDILIDLKGYTHDARLGAFAHRCAPKQVSYLGYPGSLGLPFVNYVIGDEWVTPKGCEALYSEKVIRLSQCYQSTDNKRQIAAPTSTRVSEGLPAAGFVYCCFNNAQKIKRDVFNRWMNILRRVDGSVLWLFGDDEVEAKLKAQAQQAGIEPTRLVFAKKVDQATHLARHRFADLFLDTAPYNAHTTASDALWAGLPLITVPGTSFASRVAASILDSAGMGHLVMKDWTEYEELAVQVALDPAKAVQLKEQARASRQSKLFDTMAFTRAFEQALVEIHND